MPKTYDETEDLIRQVLDSITPDSKPNFSELARLHDVPYQRLLARSKGRGDRYDRPCPSHKLTIEQENALLAYIKRLDNLGICARPHMVVSCANTLLSRGRKKSQPGPPPTVDRQWAKRWLKRQPDLFVRRERRIELDRKLSHDPDTIKEWYRGYLQIRLLM
jgi:hypothetical protein